MVNRAGSMPVAVPVTCTGIDATQTEFDFVASCRDRTPWQCRGPLVTLDFAGYQLMLLEASFRGHPAPAEILWAGFDPDRSPDRVAFTLCAAHWMDLSWYAGLNAHAGDRRDWMAQASSVLERLFAEVGWDHKEIANMLMWRRAQLT